MHHLWIMGASVQVYLQCYENCNLTEQQKTGWIIIMYNNGSLLPHLSFIPLFSMKWSSVSKNKQETSYNIYTFCMLLWLVPESAEQNTLCLVALKGWLHKQTKVKLDWGGGFRVDITVFQIQWNYLSMQHIILNYCSLHICWFLIINQIISSSDKKPVIQNNSQHLPFQSLITMWEISSRSF